MKNLATPVAKPRGARWDKRRSRGVFPIVCACRSMIVEAMADSEAGIRGRGAPHAVEGVSSRFNSCAAALRT